LIRMFLSAVAERFGDDGKDEEFYGGDFFTDGLKINTLRCYYERVIRGGSEIVDPKHKDRMLMVADRLRDAHMQVPERSTSGGVSMVARYSASLWHRITKLEERQGVLFPCGWIGHAVYCEIEREARAPDVGLSQPLFTFAIFNSGEGMQNHYSISSGYTEMYSPALIYSHIPQAEILNPTQVRAFVEPYLANFYAYVGSAQLTSTFGDMYTLALGRLEKYLDEPRSTPVMLEGQQGGVCMLFGLHHYLHFKMRMGFTGREQEEVGQRVTAAMQRSALAIVTDSVADKDLTDLETLRIAPALSGVVEPGCSAKAGFHP